LATLQLNRLPLSTTIVWASIMLAMAFSIVQHMAQHSNASFLLTVISADCDDHMHAGHQQQ
jgi:hypothetical protein